MSAHRYIMGYANTPVQQSMTNRTADYAPYNITTPMLGVVLSIQYADDPRNRNSAYKQDARSAFHMCTVLAVESGTNTNVVLEHVVIPSHIPSGVGDYSEFLPRPATKLLSGQELNSSLQNTDPYDLDGDWCIVSFLGGNIDQPYVSNWWPHAKNRLDPMTSQQGNPSGGVGTTLDQRGRYLSRINGVEYVVSRKGDIYLSTYYSNSRLTNETFPPTEGRMPRERVDDDGGSIRVNIKPSQSLALLWNTPISGVGVDGALEPALPQTNPRSENFGIGSATGTSVICDNESISLNTPGSMFLSSDGALDILGAESLYISAGGTIEESSAGDKYTNTNGNSVLTTLGQSTIRSVQGVVIEAGLVNSTAEAVAPLSISSSGDTVVSAGVRVDPTEVPPPDNTATAATATFRSTGDLSIEAGYSDDTNLPLANVVISANNETTVAADTVVYLGNTDPNEADQPYVRGTDQADALDSLVDAISDFAAAIAVAPTTAPASVALDPASLTALETAVTQFKNARNTYLSQKVKGE